jgi:CTP synthase
VKDKKIIFVTGGVVSSIGKGLTAASLGNLLEKRGLKISIMKCDPYINIDPGTMSPLQHGEVYVTDDGAETDLDLGHYERFTSSKLSRGHSITTGQVYESVIARERRGDYLGGTVQVIPHITDEIKRRILAVAANDCDILIVEIGGTIGDIEGLPFIEAIRQMRADIGSENSIFIHVTYVPYIKAAGELKSKPTQHSVKALREVGIQPDFLICRSEQPLPEDVKSKIGLFCSVHPSFVIGAEDSESIYDVPLKLHREGLDEKVCKRLELFDTIEPDLHKWEIFTNTLRNPKSKTKIALVGKYVDLKESYKSLHEALIHAGVATESEVEILYVDSEKFEKSGAKASEILKDVSGVLVPGGFGDRGVEGKIEAIKYAREQNIPFLGICLGMQLAAIEFARNVCGIEDATSREFEKVNTSKPLIINIMEQQKAVTQKGGTMRLGAYPCTLNEGTKAYAAYKSDEIQERHRHRYEFNNEFKNMFIEKGGVFSGVNADLDLVEIFEIPDHKWFVGVQFHPEFKSQPNRPHPLFLDFVKSSL